MVLWAILAALLCAAAPAATSDDPDYDVVTCGSALKLRHIASGIRLHSHEIKYGASNGGSGQQSVTGMVSDTDSNSLWRVAAQAGQQCHPGVKIKCNRHIRLLHLNTGGALHSHSGFVSPLSHQQEVSALGDEERVDKADDWVVECAQGGDFWLRGSSVRLKHAQTGRYLHHDGRSVYRRPIAGQREVCAVARHDRLSLWQAEQGLFLKPVDASRSSSQHDEL